jgi:hypothetical protein
VARVVELEREKDPCARYFVSVVTRREAAKITRLIAVVGLQAVVGSVAPVMGIQYRY